MNLMVFPGMKTILCLIIKMADRYIQTGLVHNFAGSLLNIVCQEIRFHDLRHTHATYMLKQGIHPKIVSERLGHSTTGITMDTYSHVMPGMQENATLAFENSLSSNPTSFD